MHIADLRKLLPDGYYVIHSKPHSSHLTDKDGKMVYQTIGVNNPDGSYKAKHYLNGEIFEPDGMLWANAECYHLCTLHIEGGQLTILDDNSDVVFSARNRKI